MRRPYYLFSNGRLCRRQNTLCLERASDDRSDGTDPVDTGHPSGTPTGDRAPFPVEACESIYCFGEIDVNAKLISFLAQHHIPAFFFDYYGNYTATIYPREHLLSGRLKVEQVQHYVCPERRMTLARAFVDAALHNLLRVLKYYAPRIEDSDAMDVEDAIDEIEARRTEVDTATDVETLMGLEGQSRHRYYRVWPAILGEAGTDFPFTNRSRRPPDNALNALISFGNSLCYSVALRQIYRTALDPTVSYLHEPGDRRFSLALDLAEVFKPLLVDRAIFRLIKTRQIQPKHFEPRLGGTYLTEAGREVFTTHWDERLRQTVKHRRLDRRVSYERLVRLDAHKLVRHLCDPDADPFEGLKMWW